MPRCSGSAIVESRSSEGTLLMCFEITFLDISEKDYKLQLVRQSNICKL